MSGSRVRVEYARGHRVRFLGHLDLARAMERALRRAQIPVCLTQGFNPRPKLAFASPLPLGIVGCREIMELWVEGVPEVCQLAGALGAALPAGLTVQRARLAVDGPSLMAQVDAARYRVTFAAADGGKLEADPHLDEQARRAVERLLGQSQLVVTRSRPKKPAVEVDLRPMLVQLEALSWHDFVATAGIGSTGNLRPAELVSIITGQINGDLSAVPATIKRLETGRLVDGALVSAWEL